MRGTKLKTQVLMTRYVGVFIGGLLYTSKFKGVTSPTLRDSHTPLWKFKMALRIWKRTSKCTLVHTQSICEWVRPSFFPKINTEMHLHILYKSRPSNGVVIKCASNSPLPHFMQKHSITLWNFVPQWTSVERDVLDNWFDKLKQNHHN